MSDNSGDNPGYCPVGKKSLLEKYDLTIEKLSFEYVKQCKTVKELEKICKVLRSNEEGYYPELQKCTEDRLRELAPDSRVLRVEEHIVRMDELSKEKRDEVEKEMKDWETDVASKDDQLQSCKSPPQNAAIPPVRRVPSSEKKAGEEKKKNNCKKVAVSNYESWDKYDADSELLKIDIEEERKRKEEEAKERKEKERQAKEDSRLQDVIKQAETLTEAERSVLALSEKDRGNEYFKVRDFEEAIKYYTASVTICPNAPAYSNRAACYLKLSKFEAALCDTNSCLELDPANPKGLYRRALCLQHKLKFEEALSDIEVILKKEPHNVIVRHVADKLRQQCLDMPRKFRMLIEEDNGERRMVEMSEEEAKEVRNGYEVNEFGLAKTMCKCYGRPAFLRNPNPTGIAEHLLCRPEEEKKKKADPDSAKAQGLETAPSLIGSIDKIVMDSPPLSAPLPQVRITEVDADTPTTDLSGRTVEKNKIAHTSPDSDEIPKKIKIIEAVKSDAAAAACSDKPKRNSVVKDMRRGHGRGESDLMEQLSGITIEEATAASASAARTEEAGGAAKEETNNNNNNRQRSSNSDSTPNDRKKETDKNQTGNNRRSSNSSDSSSTSSTNNTARVRNYNFNVPSEKHPITIANKYKQKVASSKATGHDSSDSSVIEQLTACKFFNLWSSVKEYSSKFSEYANILRQTNPCDLKNLLGNKLDESMLVAMVKAFSREFDLVNESDAGFVRQYLIALSRVERFQIVVRFLDPEIKKMIGALIDKIGGEEASNIRSRYMIDA